MAVSCNFEWPACTSSNLMGSIIGSLHVERSHIDGSDFTYCNKFILK